MAIRSFLPLVASALLATGPDVASAAVSSSSICSSAAFQALSGTRLGDSPIFMRALVQGDEVCIEYQLDSSVASSATWFGVGPSRGSNMVSSPASNVMMFFKDTGKPVSYLLGGYVSSDVTEESDQSAFVVGEASTSSMSFSYQRTLAAATSSEVAISATGATDFIWAYGTSWPISSHKSGTNGAATFNIAAAAAASGSGAGASTTVGSSASSPWCNDKNCPGIVGGVAFAIMAVCGLLLTAALKSSPVGKLLLHRTVAAPPVKLTTNAPVAKPHTMFIQMLADLHLGELLVMLIFIGAVVVLIALLSNEKNYVVSGQVSLLILMFLILPVARLPVWSVLFGSSFERIVKFHRWLGLIMNVAVIVHVVQASKVVNLTLNQKYGEVTPLHGFIAFVCFIAMLFLSIEYIRRMFFEVFYFTHRVLSIVGFVFTILHSPKLIGLALCVPLGLYALGLLYRWSSAFTGSYKASVSVHSGSNSTTLVLEPTPKTGKMAMNVNPGSYFLVRLPAISATQWHPFSSIVTPDGKSLGFCIKAMGNGSFTRRLLEKAGTQYELTANLCGPFGKMSLNVDRYDAVVLVAGGVGITPMMSLINQSRLFPTSGSDSDKAPKAADWYVLWSVREPEDILMMEQFLPTNAQLDYAARASVQDPNMAILGNNAPAPININWMFHVSNARTDGVVTRANGETLSYRGGQPILDELINTSRFNGRKVTVVACGPPTMTVTAQSLARNCNFDFHKEVFNW
ncbi:Transmembrane protein [Phytophthora cinnamomi]|uniref:Transmembrane protein n=1 Tax=Phytophthora cinnamomi TaxID=4785 RepID=UPI00355A3F02|nr:Transmembrane protein [Phytophthora cinnamomi]